MTTPTRADWERLKLLCHGALEQPAEGRERWLREAAGGNRSLLHEAQALVDAHQTLGGFLEDPPTVDPADLLDDVLAPGTMVGPYVVRQEIGRGGMGIVYLAEDRRLGRLVALKALPPAAANDPAVRERLRREARAAATISHPGVATVYALEETPDGLFIASEYVAGGTLREELGRGRIEPARALTLAADIARALCAAHEAGVIHRDLKPENVLLQLPPEGGSHHGADGRYSGVKVVDFGIAYVQGAEATRLTRDGALMGTPAYMAPEQLVGGVVDARADLYAFGVILAEMVGGSHPLRTPAPTLPPRVAPIVARCLQADPAARFASARELLAALEQAVDSPAIQHSPARRWWWEFHQAVAALLYWLMVIPLWNARAVIGGVSGRALFIVALAAVIVAANLRLHLWFTSRFYPRELRWLRTRVGRLIHGADWVFALSLIAGALMLPDERPALATLLLSFGIGSAVAFLVIEPATARAAFRSPALFLLLALVGACSREQPREPRAEEQIVPVAARPAAIGNMRAVLHVSGVMTPAPGAEFIVTAPEPARVVEVTKNEGDVVASGELLVRFDIPSATGELARQRADLARAQAELENARVVQTRNRDLAQRGLIARREQEDADRAFIDAQSAVARAEATLRAAEEAAARTMVLAPFAGIVTQRLHNPGDVVQGAATDPILRVVDPRRLEVAAMVPAGDLARVLPGASARLAGGADGKPVPLTVTGRPGPNEVGPSGMATVRLAPLAPTTLPVDAPVQVDIDLGERADAVVVPPEALVRAGTTTAVFVVNGDRAERRAVTTGLVDETRAELTSGVQPGELVITRGQNGLEDGARISVDVTRRAAP